MSSYTLRGNAFALWEEGNSKIHIIEETLIEDGCGEVEVACEELNWKFQFFIIAVIILLVRFHTSIEH